MAESGEPRPVAPESAIWQTLRQPRVMLILLALWAILGAISEFASDSFLFDLKGEANGVLGGRALSAEAIVLAVLYLYAARDPERYRQVFWLALIEQGVAFIANIYHWGAGDFGLESIILPVAVAAGLGVLLLLHLVQPRPEAIPQEREPPPIP